MRFFALPMCFATRCESASPCSGQNHGRTLRAVHLHGRGSLPVCCDLAARPELLEREREGVGDLAASARSR